MHSDRGAQMTSIKIAKLLEDLAVARSLSRPRVSDDNPYSEAAFKTVKYRPSYPDRFDSIEHARVWMRDFVAWYNTEHHHSGIGYLQPADLHNGTANSVIDARQNVLDAAYQAHPERFIAGPPKAARPQPQRGSTSQPSKQKARSTGNNHLTASAMALNTGPRLEDRAPIHLCNDVRLCPAHPPPDKSLRLRWLGSWEWDWDSFCSRHGAPQWPMFAWSWAEGWQAVGYWL